MAQLITDVATELVDLAAAKAAAKIDHSYEDDYITGLISSARVSIQNYINQAIGSQVWRDVKANPSKVSVLSSPLIPLISATITLDGASVDLTEAVIDPSIGYIENISPELTGKKLVINWTVGMTICPADLKYAWLSLIAFYYENRGADDQVAIPADVKRVLDNYKVYRV